MATRGVDIVTVVLLVHSSALCCIGLPPFSCSYPLQPSCSQIGKHYHRRLNAHRHLNRVGVLIPVSLNPKAYQSLPPCHSQVGKHYHRWLNAHRQLNRARVRFLTAKQRNATMKEEERVTDERELRPKIKVRGGALKR